VHGVYTHSVSFSNFPSNVLLDETLCGVHNCDCDATATKNKHVHVLRGRAKLIAANHNAGIGLDQLHVVTSTFTNVYVFHMLFGRQWKERGKVESLSH